MIDLTLTPEQRLVRESARAFTTAEILPHIREWDERREVHREVFDRMGELGYLGAPVPEAYGGAGLDYVSFGLLCEELERADTAFRVIMSVHVGLNSLTLLQWGTEDQKRRFLVPQAKGEKLATFGLTEPGVGTDAANLQTTARRDGDAYVLNGSKMWISLADVADHFLVFATLDRAKGHRGITAFVVERGMPGFSTGTHRGQDGHPRRQHGHALLRRGPRARREPRRRGGRGLRHRHERHRPGPLHGRDGGGGARAGLPRRVGRHMPTSATRSGARSASTSSSSR